jgi:predicted dehydrogenase
MKNKRQKDKENKSKISRREFMSGAAAAMAFTIVPRHVLGGEGHTAPSEKLNVAGVGVGGMGGENLSKMANENIVALCDVDEKYAAETFKQYPRAKKYRDYREMLEKQKDIEGVVIATPDHTHAIIAMAAMQMGKHVYVQKPLTYSVYEARMLTEASRKYKVATQMGNQRSAFEL